ncbi:MAG: NERD domain-containing protein [Prevotella sp.]|jgi:sugar-specific transcriptional regulator TrmB|nr:NERD domain-containing protein [Prevotella sp.]
MNPNVFNDSGAITELFRILRSKSIYRFKSINDIIDYKRNYPNEIENIRARIKNEINEEIKKLTKENENLLDEYDRDKTECGSLLCAQIDLLKSILSSSRNNLFSKIKKYRAKRKLNLLEPDFDWIVEKQIKHYLVKIDSNKKKINHLTYSQLLEIERRSKPFIRKIEHIVSELNSLSAFIYGSVGELKAIELLRKLPNEYYIINDFRKSFDPPLYHKSEDDRIYSTQLDHIVIGPTGVFVIETKYWSRKSTESNDLFSPIKQLRRGGFALYIIINEITKNSNSFLSNWGHTKVSVSNILLMMGASVNNQFEHVKILTESNCIYYITRGPTILNKNQIDCLVKRLLR